MINTQTFYNALLFSFVLVGDNRFYPLYSFLTAPYGRHIKKKVGDRRSGTSGVGGHGSGFSPVFWLVLYYR